METNLLGFAGTALVLIAYIPQIYHLVIERCAAGVSIKAFATWLVASLLLLYHAVAIGDTVFITLQSLHAVAVSIILICATFFQKGICMSHIKHYQEQHPEELKKSTRNK